MAHRSWSRQAPSMNSMAQSRAGPRLRDELILVSRH
jgi:hypothetical protein